MLSRPDGLELCSEDQDDCLMPAQGENYGLPVRYVLIFSARNGYDIISYGGGSILFHLLRGNNGQFHFFFGSKCKQTCMRY